MKVDHKGEFESTEHCPISLGPADITALDWEIEEVPVEISANQLKSAISKCLFAGNNFHDWE